MRFLCEKADNIEFWIIEKCFARMFRKIQFLYLVEINSYRYYKKRWIACNVNNFWSMQDIKISPSGNVNWILLNMLAKYFSIFFSYVLSVFSQRKYTIYHQTHFSNEFSQHYWPESFDGDSFVSQSRLDAYAILNSGLQFHAYTVHARKHVRSLVRVPTYV